MPVESAGRLTALFTKRPVAGLVKTRLCPPLDLDQAACLAEAMLRDALETCVRSSAFRTALLFAPPEEGEWFRREFPEPGDQRAQQGKDLGERLARFFETAFTRGTRTAVAIGSDQPLVTAARIAEAHAALESGADCVLGPDLGGGYYLIGLRASLPELFTEVRMSEASTCQATVRLAGERGLEHRMLPPLSDVDVADDLARLRADLEDWFARGGSGDPGFPRRTHALLRGPLAQPWSRTAVP